MVKDHAQDLGEWIDHYLKLGVGRIYMYDHGTMPLLLPIVAELVEMDVIVYHWLTSDMMERLSGFKYKPPKPGSSISYGINPQIHVYQLCIKRHLNNHRWMAFFDTDEFLLLRNRSVKDLPTFLKDYELYGGLVVQWRIFGSNRHLVKPNGTVLENYLTCYLSDGVKSIVNTRYVVSTVGNAHAFKYSDGKYAVNEDLQRVDGAGTVHRSINKVVLNHYVTKSAAEYLAKVARGSGDGRSKKGEAYFNYTNKWAIWNCTDAIELMKGRVWNRTSMY